jgi:hypothetical protein
VAVQLAVKVGGVAREPEADKALRRQQVLHKARVAVPRVADVAVAVVVVQVVVPMRRPRHRRPAVRTGVPD